MTDLSLKFAEPVGILGFGVEGQSTLRYLIAQGVRRIAILDQKAVQLQDMPSEVQVEVFSGERYLDGLEHCRTVVRSAGVNPLLMPLLQFSAKGGVVTSQIQIFMERSRSARIIGVTGTLGKGSCVSMIAHCLEALGVPHALGGNFGVAALDLLSAQTEDQVAILELSSFQLMTLSMSPPIAVVLKTTSEHLDWHRSVEEYRDAKANLVRWQRPGDLCVYNADAEGSVWIASQGSARKQNFGASLEANAYIGEGYVEVDGKRLALTDCKAKGLHQLENMGAALLALKGLGCDVGACMEALRSYHNLKYRLQYDGEKGGVAYYNDSYATRPEATIAAASSMDRPFALILGGSEKHADFSELAQTLSSLPRLRGIALIGQTAARLRSALEQYACPAEICGHAGLDEAFAWSTLKAGPGGAVLMSPACASFGLFPNYKVRGERFDALYAALSN